MPKFNVIQKQRRAAIADRKRIVHGDPFTGKLHLRKQPLSISGKRRQKLLRKWNRERKEALEKGLIAMHDLEMTDAAETKKSPVKFSLKKSAKLFRLKKKDKKKNVSKTHSGEASSDAIMEE